MYFAECCCCWTIYECINDTEKKEQEYAQFLRYLLLDPHFYLYTYMINQQHERSGSNLYVDETCILCLDLISDI